MDSATTTQHLQAFTRILRNSGGYAEDCSLSHHDDTSIEVEAGVIPVAKICGTGLATSCAKQIKQSLNSYEVEELCRFLQEVHNDRISSAESLQSSLSGRLAQFYSEETSLSGQDTERLGRPGGPVHALLGLILHVQSEDDTIDAFWDSRSATINMFKEKGIDENFVFGYDWHWRAQGAFKRKQGRPRSKMSPELVHLHDSMSSDILDILSPPFLLTASAYARKGVQKSLSRDARSLKINLGNGCGSIQLDLGFREGRLRRFIIHIHHPVAGFHTSRKERPHAAVRIVASINLILWLLGKPHNPLAFFTRYSSRPPRLVWHAPLQEMWEYYHIEISNERSLGLEDFTPTFLGWAGRYLGQDPVSIISNGGSLIATITEIIRSRMSISSKTNYTKKRQRAEEKQRNDREEQQRAEEKQRRDREKQQRVEEKQRKHREKQQRAEEKRRLIVTSGLKRKRALCSTPKAYKAKVTRIKTSTKSTNSPRTEPDTNNVMDFEANHLLNDNLSKTSSPKQTIKTEDQQFEERMENILKMTPWCLTDLPSSYLPASEIREFVIDSMPVPVPMDDLCDESIELKYFVAVQDTVNADLVELRSLEGARVTSDSHGRVKLSDAPPDLDLQLQVSHLQTAKFVAAREGLRVYFLLHELHIRESDEILYKKSYERILSSRWAPSWLPQLIYEQGALRQRRPELFTDKTVGPQRALRLENSYWNHGELKRRLYEGSRFACHREKKLDGTVYGYRVGLRGISLCIPFSADPENVLIQAVLFKEGEVHPHPLAASARPGEPAQRLGIRIKYQTPTSEAPIQYWATIKGDVSACKANSLVDFL